MVIELASEPTTVDGSLPLLVLAGGTTLAIAGSAGVLLLLLLLGLPSGRIRVSVDLLLYEGESEATNDLDGQVHTSFIVGAGQTLSKAVTASNSDEGDDDYAKVSLTCKNSPA